GISPRSPEPNALSNARQSTAPALASCPNAAPLEQPTLPGPDQVWHPDKATCDSASLTCFDLHPKMTEPWGIIRHSSGRPSRITVFWKNLAAAEWVSSTELEICS